MKSNFPLVSIARNSDLEEILKLQKLSYVSEAEIYNDYNIQPMVQSIDELIVEFSYMIILKLEKDKKIVGSVRAYQKDGTCYIGKLIVHPDYQNQGMGRMLIEAIEFCFKGSRYELFTGGLSSKNLYFYRKCGYKIFKKEIIDKKIDLVYMEKLADMDKE